MNTSHHASLVHRGIVTTAVGFALMGVVSTAWAATPVSPTVMPISPNATAARSGAAVTPSAMATATATSTGATTTATARVTETPMPFAVQGSMAKDAGSSMGSDMIAPSSVPTPARNAVRPMAANSGNTPGGTVSLATAASGGACMALTTGNAITRAEFQMQWQAGETVAANFWGPAGTGEIKEPYGDGQRTVQYFDKGRMEAAGNGGVTNGLLATELITGQLQTGDASFQAKPAPAIPIAGDPDNAGPTYAALGTTAASLLAPAPQSMQAVSAQVAADGTVSTIAPVSDPATQFTRYDAATQHNLPQAFAQYRDTVGVSAVGLAKSEPFFATVKVGGVQKAVMIQVFERRVLTYTADNDPAFRVEMGNIGQHYYRWRYCP